MTTDTEGNVIHIFGRKLTPINIRRNNTAKILYSHELVAAVRCGLLSDPAGSGLGLGSFSFGSSYLLPKQGDGISQI